MSARLSSSTWSHSVGPQHVVARSPTEYWLPGAWLGRSCPQEAVVLLGKLNKAHPEI
jgi:hypothetical protein